MSSVHGENGFIEGEVKRESALFVSETPGNFQDSGWQLLNLHLARPKLCCCRGVGRESLVSFVGAHIDGCAPAELQTATDFISLLLTLLQLSRVSKQVV